MLERFVMDWSQSDVLYASALHALTVIPFIVGILVMLGMEKTWCETTDANTNDNNTSNTHNETVNSEQCLVFDVFPSPDS